MDNSTLNRVIKIIDQHINELLCLPGNPIGKDQAVAELKMLRAELIAEGKK